MQEKFNPKKIKLIIGLGNPGKVYENTYHNAGYLFIDYVKREVHPTRYKLQSTNCYMNRSGEIVKKILKNSNLKPENLIIVHDDSDLTLGAYKLSFGVSSAGHYGVSSVINALKTKSFWRLRIGIRNAKREAGLSAETQRVKAGEFVLKNISSPHKKILDQVFENIVNHHIPNS